ncbi:hypothetical protein [Streptomyces sp. NBC_00582]|uniref:hypothetical protein n=1 Tax=Streptomyces sp. NBC_00582 TaxID=2975783 RepID=UPI0010D9E32C|nr:hypothetical protein [Streptomyces sp. NBC_00582]WUB63191.1 hypothetical protein OG852_23685 [Streptomyces sp. NBC_00582]
MPGPTSPHPGHRYVRALAAAVLAAATLITAANAVPARATPTPPTAQEQPGGR